MKLKLVFFLCFLSGMIFSQSIESQIDSVKKMLESFEYIKVINASNKLLINRELKATNKIEILRLKAISHFSLWDEQSTELCFIEILKIDQDYMLDSLRNSPKLISLFEKVKNDYIFEIFRIQNEKDSIKFINPNNDILSNISYDRDLSYVKSMILPGWGQVSKSEFTKGWIMISSGIASLGAVLYYSIQTNKTERDYLSEINIHKISEKYSAYNDNYRCRNIAIAAYISIWIFSQLDLIFPVLTEGNTSIKNSNRSFFISPLLERNSFKLNCSFSF